MNNRTLLLAAAPSASSVGHLAPGTAIAAETATARAMPKIRIPTSPAKLEKAPHILTQIPAAEEETAKLEDEHVAPEHRASTGGACYLAATAWSSKEEDTDTSFSKVTGVHSESRMQAEYPAGRCVGVVSIPDRKNASCL